MSISLSSFLNPISTNPNPQQCHALKGMSCKQFTSCQQARTALACGNLRIDGDKDSTPCEALCR
ncbi:MAG: excalibur calcium-binding domain-containing protein [Moraxella sp.]|nr:excalibur calcium-binding domain-containing protein [Moraxella sp.]